MYDEEQQPEHGPSPGSPWVSPPRAGPRNWAPLLQRRGATVLHAPALRIVPLADDSELLAATKGDHRPGPGRGRGHHRDRLPGVGRGRRRLGPRRAAPRPAARGYGCWPAVRRSRARSARRASPRSGRPPRSPWPRCSTASWRRASTATASPYSCTASPSPASSSRCGPPARRWSRSRSTAGCRRRTSAPWTASWTRPSPAAWTPLTFTSAPAAASLLSRAEARGLRDELLAALAHDVLPACVGPVTALPLQAHGVDTVQPERFRLGPLVQLLCQELPARARCLPVAGHQVEIRGHAVLVDGRLKPVPRPACPCCAPSPAAPAGWSPVPTCSAPSPARAGRRTRRGNGDGPTAYGAGGPEADPDGGETRLPPGPGPGGGHEVRGRLATGAGPPRLPPQQLPRTTVHRTVTDGFPGRSPERCGEPRGDCPRPRPAAGRP